MSRQFIEMKPLEDTHLNSAIALRAQWGQELLEAVLAVQIALLLDEPNVSERTLAVGVVADEVIRAPDASQRRNERSSVEKQSVFQVLAVSCSRKSIVNLPLFPHTHNSNHHHKKEDEKRAPGRLKSRCSAAYLRNDLVITHVTDRILVLEQGQRTTVRYRILFLRLCRCTVALHLFLFVRCSNIVIALHVRASVACVRRQLGTYFAPVDGGLRSIHVRGVVVVVLRAQYNLTEIGRCQWRHWNGDLGRVHAEIMLSVGWESGLLGRYRSRAICVRRYGLGFVACFAVGVGKRKATRTVADGGRRRAIAVL